MNTQELIELLLTKDPNSKVFFVSRRSVSELHNIDVSDFDASELKLTSGDATDEIIHGVFLNPKGF